VEHAAVSDDTAPVAPPLVELPTSDESESLLRIRHTVRACALCGLAEERWFFFPLPRPGLLTRRLSGCFCQSAHVLAMAVQRLFPKAQVTIGPW
jgi:hypothetical protein